MSKMNMRTRVLFTILPVAIIPIMVVSGFSSLRLFHKLKEQSNVFYSTILKQVANNIDFIYSQYAATFVDIASMDNFKKIIDEPQFTSQIDERSFLKNMGEADGDPKGNTVTRAAFTKFKGSFFLLETDKKSLFKNEDHILNEFSAANFGIDYSKFINDRMYLDVRKNPQDAKVVFGKPGDGVISGFEAEKSTLFVYPYFREGETIAKKIMFVIMNKDFIPDLYKDIDSIKYGTVYVLDKYNNIIASNHPSSDDYYDFDKNKGRYVQGKDDAYIKEEKMGIADYRLLNIDPKIIDMTKVKGVLNDLSSDTFDSEAIRTARFKGVDYLFITKYAPESQVKLLYFHPLKQVYSPIYSIVWWIFVISIGIIAFIIIVSNYLSVKLSNPIKGLANGSKRITQGDYKIQIDTNGFFGEFIDLGNIFNSMVRTINQYSEHLEDIVKQRTEALNKANLELKAAYDENRKELLMAQRIQSSLIPKHFPESDHIDFFGMYLPMEALGGDFYDVHKISEHKMGIVILDVCGHGVPAALITTMAKISFNACSKMYEHSYEIMSAVNNELCDAIQGSGDYFTAFYCIIDTEKRTVEFTNAAHNDIYVLRSNGNLEVLNQTGPVVGVIKDIEYNSETISLSEGDRLILYTDGVIEARSEDRSLYDTQRFKDMIMVNKDKTPKEFINIIYADILKFKKNTPHDDDIAILVADLN